MDIPVKLLYRSESVTFGDPA